MSNVGYKKPPKHTQFKKGQSGNPRGRPKGSKNLRTILEQELSSTITITDERGQSQAISQQEVIIKRAIQQAMQGDLKAIQSVIKLITQIVPNHAAPDHDRPLHQSDQAIVNDFLERMKQENQS